ncbi:MAG: universal stress protein [Oscillatoriales cyanobacterium SM2_1_8]|nr:universal stress protein [Oscillatoriales cyanobacterium SM2_1_8]
MLQQILVTVDGSGRSREMANMLMALPSLQNVQVSVLHVIPVAASSEGLTEYRLAGERILEKEANSLRLPQGGTLTKMLKEGEPKDVVCQVAAALQPDFLVMGSRGLGRLQAILANSVSQYVFQLASVPMILVKDDVYIKAIRRVMVSVDGSAAANFALTLTANLLQGSKDAEIQLLRVVKQGDETDTAETDTILAEAGAKLNRLGVAHKKFLRRGDIAREICQAAEDNNVGLVVVGSADRRPSIARGLPDLDRLLGSSVSDYVRVNAPCPVLLARTDEN